MIDEASAQLEKAEIPKRSTLPEGALLGFIIASFTLHDDLPLWGLILLMLCTCATWFWMVFDRQRRERAMLSEQADRVLTGNPDSDP
ncbi:hypothetical protein [Novipirellula artificiosorum]|uniref:Uncharacterized protein n=1 Tax=Novipirellula artificiosorum TaxID=2528016 RepID=A0A5C6CZJ9_9BACT|nr:hypothetical protein [Novipirellula artificiosorum]TWU28901.1 hypothetical protein Poly41_68520 [Novipirellula artificiosorum]